MTLAALTKESFLAVWVVVMAASLGRVLEATGQAWCDGRATCITLARTVLLPHTIAAAAVVLFAVGMWRAYPPRWTPRPDLSRFG
jgi:hypothetical protein